MSDNGEKKYIEIEDELNIALSKIGKETELDNSKVSMDEKISNITVEDLLKELKTDEFEKIYISSAVQSNSFNNELNDINKIQNMAEYQLSQMKNEDKIDNKTKDSLKSASNFYLIPHLVNQRYNVGKDEKVKEINFYTVNDVDGYSLYTIIGDNITLSTGFKNKIENYLESVNITA